MIISMYRSYRDVLPNAIFDGSLREFYDTYIDKKMYLFEVDYDEEEGITKRDWDKAKASPGCFIPARMSTEKPSKTATNVIDISTATLDCDDHTDEDRDKLLSAIEHTDYIFYTTASHGAVGLPGKDPGLHRYRVIIELDQVVDTKVWKQLWPRLNIYCHNLLDQACKNPNRLYYLPGRASNIPYQQEHEAYFHVGKDTVRPRPTRD